MFTENDPIEWPSGVDAQIELNQTKVVYFTVTNRYDTTLSIDIEIVTTHTH